MNKQNTSTFFAMLALSCGILLISSCKPADDFELYDSWKVTGAEFDPPQDISGTMVTDAYPLMFSAACDQDDLLIFEEDGGFIEDEGAVKCNSADPQQASGTFTMSGTTITIYNASGDTIIFTGIEITESNLTGSINIPFGSGTANVDMTMTRQ